MPRPKASPAASATAKTMPMKSVLTSSAATPIWLTGIFRLDLGNVGIFALDYDPLDAGTDSLRQVTVQLYAETMKFFNLQNSPA